MAPRTRAPRFRGGKGFVMAMNVQPVPTLSDRTNEIRAKTAEIINTDVLPNETELWAWRRNGSIDESGKAAARELRLDIQAKVKAAGLWAPHLPAEYGGCDLGFLDHAYMNEVFAYCIGGASLFGVVAPNSGNQKILLKYGTEEQKQKWLVPLTEGRMQSGFSMTEPDTAGSDPRSLKTTARRDGDEWVINGHKWFTSNGKNADFLIVMCRTEDPAAAAGENSKMTQIIVPTDTPGLNRAGCPSGAATATTVSSSTTTSACRSPISSGRAAPGTRRPKIVWARGASTTA